MTRPNGRKNVNSITIKADYLRALALLTSDDPKRPAMHGILLDATSTDAFLVATDGIVMGVIRIAGKAFSNPVSVIIPPDVVSAHARRSANDVIVTKVRSKWTIKSAGPAIDFTPIDEAYPDWRRVIPRTLSGVPSQINPDLLATMKKVDSVLNGRRIHGVTIRHNGPDGANIVRLHECDEFFGIVMPFRADHLVFAQDWVVREAEAAKKGGAA